MPRPRAHSCGVIRRFPAGWTPAINTASVPHATVMPSPVDGHYLAGRGRVARRHHAGAEQLDLAARRAADAPGRGSYARMIRETVRASADQSTRVIDRSTLDA